jgi:hypothetical protein
LCRNLSLLMSILLLLIGTAAPVYLENTKSHGINPAQKNSNTPPTDPRTDSRHSSDSVSFMPFPSQSVTGADKTATNLGLQSGACGARPPCGNLTYHGGHVMHSPTNYLIFWLPPGYSFDNSTVDPRATNPSNGRYEQLIIGYFSDICKPNSLYAIIQQYTDNISPIGSCALGSYWRDNSSYPGGRGSASDPLTDADITNEVSNAMTANSWTANNGNNEFFVFTGYNVTSCVSFPTFCSNNAFCAYHSSFFTGVSSVIYSNMPDLCISGPSPNNDPLADTEITISSHEQFESATDPVPATGWFYQDTGHEIGDECAWIFDSAGSTTTLRIGTDNYAVQEEWSNSAGGCTSQGFGCAATMLATDVLGCDGLGPTTIGLTWGQSGYGIFFSKYEVQQSNSGASGPWTTIDTIGSISATSDYVRDLSPKLIYWWQVVEVSCCGQTTTTNVIGVTQPSASTLTKAALNPTTYKLTWNNNEAYTGTVAFDSYALMESTDQDVYNMVGNVTSESTTEFNITISPSHFYSLYLTTTDKCDGCLGHPFSISDSNVLGVDGPPTFVGGLFGEYWNASFFGSALSGCTTYTSPVTPSLAPTKTVTDPQVSFGTSVAWNWHPLGTGNEFSAKWIGGIMIPTNGTYSFQLSSDDGSWLYLDSALVLNHGGPHSLSDIPGSASLPLTDGLHQIEIDYYETCGPPSGVTLSWTPPGLADSALVPSNVLVPPPRIDSQGVYSGSCANTHGCQLLSTNNAQDIVLLVANCEGNCTSVTPSVSDSSGLSFKMRTTYCYQGSLSGSCLWEYYALANAPVSKDNITSMPNVPPFSVRWRVMTLAISGADPNSIFDTLLPAQQHCAALDGSPADCIVSFSTSPISEPAPYEFLLATNALNDAGQCNSPPSQGWNLPVFFDGNQEADYQIAPLTQRTYSFTCTMNGDPFIILADGILGRAPDFTMNANSPRIMVDSGMVGTLGIMLTSLDGFHGLVSLAVSQGLGISCALSPKSVSLVANASSTLSCAGTVGLYNVTIRASGGGRSHYNSIPLQIMDFNITASPTSLTVPAGTNSTSTIGLRSLEGYSGNITLTPSTSSVTIFSITGGLGGGRPLEMAPMPCDPAVALNSPTLFLSPNGTGQSFLTVSASSCVSPGIYIISISASGSGLVHSVKLNITVPGTMGSRPGASTISSSSRTADVLQISGLGPSLPVLAWMSVLLVPFGFVYIGYVRWNRLPSRKRLSPTNVYPRLHVKEFRKDPLITLLLRH